MPGIADAMTVSEFLAKTRALKAEGMLAMFSSDATLLKREIGGIAAEYRAKRLADKAGGRPPHSCPPDHAKMSGDTLLAALEQIPRAQQDVSLKDGFAATMHRLYPCAR
ncbi:MULTISPECIES: hypothetical protein [unclassified Sphingomonas]|uniref:hypothetical protein n=1 Tax=unclassified Sphingomonas TaxID=196159 RepID=UPI001F1DAC7D|nr:MULTISPECIES: hypothetical protein [unclassified Sphingomonas]